MGERNINIFLKDCPKREQTTIDDNNLTLAKGKSMGQTEARLSLQSSQSSSPGNHESFWNVHTRKSLSVCEFVLVVVSCFLVTCALRPWKEGKGDLVKLILCSFVLTVSTAFQNLVYIKWEKQTEL